MGARIFLQPRDAGNSRTIFLRVSECLRPCTLPVAGIVA